MTSSRRQAALADIPAVVELAQAFHAAAAPPFAFERLEAARTARRLIVHPDGFLRLLELEERPAGVLAGWASRHPFGGFDIAAEILWWVDPAARVGAARLKTDFEIWARDKGCRLVSMSSLAGDERVASFYARGGYRAFETNFLKELA